MPLIPISVPFQSILIYDKKDFPNGSDESKKILHSE